ncbi:MAG: hypothetical protein ABGX71_06360 [Methyloprofundus sp.]|uniref:hypothetical protein n=1 Tax=Methyloprofundus sp. TaxID=2020875 RepID=UPI00262E994E|nr:hypothetical protein [Methyloprofundus sp.]
MKKIIFLIFGSLFLQACSDDNKTDNTTSHPAATKSIKEAPQKKAPKSEPAKSKWNGTSLSDATIKKVQQDKYNYTQCVYTEAQKKGYQKIDSRIATDAVIKQCEPELAIIRATFINDGVPEVIADRYLKKTRVQMIRKILQSLMFAEAARNAGATQ